mgnify:CR=1 FL=1
MRIKSKWQIVELLILNLQLVQSPDCVAGVDFLSLIQIGQSQNFLSSLPLIQ